MRDERKGMVAVLVAGLGYGTLPVLAKLALEMGVGVTPLLAWRFTIGALAMWVALGVSRGGAVPSARLPGLVALGVLYSGNAIAYMAGLDRVPASTASLVFFTYPAVVVLLSRIALGEPLTSRRLTALALAVTGCTLTVGGGLSGGEPLGFGLLFVSVLVVSLFIVSSHRVMQGIPALPAVAVTLTATAVVTVIAALATGGLALEGGRPALVLVVLIGLVGTAVPVTLFMVGIKWIGPGKAAIYSTLEPVITVVLASLVLDERLGAGQVIGGALILSALLWLRLERPPIGEDSQPLEAP